MTSASLKSLLAEYVALLRMGEWKLTLNYVPANHKELRDGKQYRLGSVEFLVEEKKATIYVSRARKQNKVTTHDHEITLVHELLHCKFGTVHKDESSEFEFAIDSTAEALVRLKRAARGK